MSRVKELQKRIRKELKKLEDSGKMISHLHGVSVSAVLLAGKRGQDPELAAMAGLLHDLYAYQAGSYEDHAHKGAKLAREILEELGITTAAETEAICSAIWKHDDKENTDGPLDEILKDADVMDHTLSDPAKEVSGHEKARYEKLCAELGMKNGTGDGSAFH